MILRCNCKNEGQDAIHGKQNRVHNRCAGGKISGDKFRCTVCGNEREGRKR